MKDQRKMDYHEKGPGVGTRLSEPPANVWIEYGYKKKMEDAKYTFASELWNHKAHTIMLSEQGLIQKEGAAKILKVLNEIESMGIDRFPLDPNKGELFYNVESYLIGKIGEDPGGRMHSGRSRGDMYVCSERMILREKMLRLFGDILSLIETIVGVSSRHVETVMPGYTLLQHAQPITFAHYLLSFADRFFRDLQRLRETFTRVNQSPMGSAIVSGTSLPLNRPRMAELLGFDGIVENTRDASISRDFNLESVAHAAIALSNLSALADDLNVWCTYEFNLIELADAYCGTSSIMPQKKNPSSLERVRYLYADSIGSTMTVFSQLKTHSEQLGDLEATGTVAWRTYDTAEAAFRLMEGILSTLKVNKETMQERAGANFTQATQLAETIVLSMGLPFRTAHRIVGRLVKETLDRHIAPTEITPEMLDDASVQITGQPLKMDAETIRNAMDVKYIIEHRKIPGGPGKKEVQSMIESRSRDLAKEREWLTVQLGAIRAAKELVDSIAEKMISR